MKRENFFVLLELPFDPPPGDPAEIKAAIQAKHREWSRRYDDPKTSSAALAFMELVPEMEEVLLNPLTRMEEADRAKEQRERLRSPFLAEVHLLESKGYLHPREIKSLEEKYGPYGFTGVIIRETIQVPITDTPPKESTPSFQVLATNRALVQEIQSHLSVLGQKNLYDFLQLSPASSLHELLAAAQKKQHEAFHSVGKTGVTTATQQLADLAIQVLELPETKAAYDRYLEVSAYPELNTLIHEEYDKSKFISPEILIRLVNFGVTTYGLSVLEAEEHIRQFSAAYNIPVAIAPPQIICPNCGKDSPRGTSYCSYCATPLEGHCPSCNTFFSDGAAVCTTCSFPIGNMGKALPYLEQVETALIENNWSAAQHGIKYMTQYWPTHPRLGELNRQAEQVEAQYTETIQEIETAQQHNRYYAAQQLAEEAAQRQIALPKELLRNIHRTVQEFESQLEFIKHASTVDFDDLHTLASHVSDSLELGRMLSKYPPEPPTRFTARPNGETVLLNWGKSTSVGTLEYIVVRKENSVPLTAYDGEVLYQGGENAFEDTQVPPLKSFFYSVFVERGGSFSEMGAVAAAPIRIIPELKNFLITPADRAAQLTWAPSQELRQVKIWRKEGEERPIGPGEGVELKTTRLDGYTDMDLENDTFYWYYIVAVYHTKESGYMESEGQMKSITPHKLVSPIDHYSLAKNEELPDTYLVNWEGAPREHVMFLHSPFEPVHHVGQMVETTDLLQHYNRLHLENQTPTSAQFQFRFYGGTYLFPVVVSGRFGSVGRVEYLTNVPEVENLTYDIIDSDLFINFRWPSGTLPSVTIAYRKDSFPASFDQKGTTRLECTREEYDYNAGVKIPDIEKGRYYILVYSTFLSPEGKKIYSQGERLFVDNRPAKEFFYTIKYSRPFFSSHHQIQVTVEAEEPFQLPRGLLVGKVGQVPLSITDGDPLFEIQREEEISGSITYEYTTEKLSQNLYVRLFFFNTQDYQRLRPIPGKSLRLT